MNTKLRLLIPVIVLVAATLASAWFGGHALTV